MEVCVVQKCDELLKTSAYLEISAARHVLYQERIQASHLWIVIDESAPICNPWRGVCFSIDILNCVVENVYDQTGHILWPLMSYQFDRV